MNCPLCNWKIVDRKCTNTVSYCKYRGVGVSREEQIADARQEEEYWKKYWRGDFEPDL